MNSRYSVHLFIFPYDKKLYTLNKAQEVSIATSKIRDMKLNTKDCIETEQQDLRDRKLRYLMAVSQGSP